MRLPFIRYSSGDSFALIVMWSNLGGILVKVTEQNLAKYKDQTGELKVAVAYTNGNDTNIYITSIKGKFVEPSGSSKDFFEWVFLRHTASWKQRNNSIFSCVWLPDGYSKTLAILGEHCGIQSSPYLDLADDLRQHTLTGKNW